MNRLSYLLLILLLASTPASAQLSFTTLNTASTANLLGIHFADTATGYACGDGGVILKTTNGGATWTPLTTGTTNNLWDVRVIPQSGGQKVIAVGDNNTVIKSVDAGNSWTAQSAPFAPGSFIFGLSCLDSSTYFACGGDVSTFTGTVLKTTDGGATWTGTAVAGTGFLDKIFMLSATSGFTVGTGSSFTEGTIRQTSNGPAWANVKTTPGIVTNVWGISTSDAVSVGLGGQIWKSADGGATWASKDVNATDLYGIAFRDALHGYACGGSPSGCVILSTTDGGDTWAEESYSFNGTLQAACAVGDRLFMAGDGGRIIKATTSGTTGIIQSALAGTRFSVYPNPATDRIMIANPDHLDGLSIRIWSLSGGMLAEQSIPATGGEFQTSRFARGVYRYALLRAGREVGAGRLIIQ